MAIRAGELWNMGHVKSTLNVMNTPIFGHFGASKAYISLTSPPCRAGLM